MKSHNIYASAVLKGSFIICLLILISGTGCKKYLEIPLPTNKISGEAAYQTDRSSAATLSNILATLMGSGIFDGGSSIGYYTGLYTDELTNLNINFTTNVAFYSDAVNDTHTGGMWTALYQNIYNANLAIEGVSASTTLLNKNQWLGEAYFVRALSYFYLTNYYGDVAIVKTSDYAVNKDLGRSPKEEAYKLIIADLLQAQSLLTNEYKDAAGNVTTSKGRPNKYTATALLARAYLYTGDWANAEIQSGNVIDATIGAAKAYTLVPAANIENVFIAASTETIFNLVATFAVRDYGAYNNNMAANIPYNAAGWSGVAAALSPSLVNAFETNPTTLTDDRRKTYWTRMTTMAAGGTFPAQTKYFPNKYKSTVIAAENIILFRLAEQYLIRAEARARLNKLDDARTDLNVIRTRAGLNGTSAVLQDDVVKAVLKERRVEYFAELGNRFFDLRRTGTIDAVMNVEAPLKGVGATWNSLKQYFPISAYDISVNPKLIQTPGY
jgi:hypothetical protein